MANTKAIATKDKKRKESKGTIKQVFADVEFGFLVNNRCKNYGVCKIEVIDSLMPSEGKDKSCKCKSCVAILSYQENGNSEIAFAKSGMKDKVRNKFFSENYFKVDANFSTIIAENKSEYKTLIKIKKGRYSISETLGFFIVKFY